MIKFYNFFLNIKNSIIQCETEIPAFLSTALKDKNNKIIFDKHGLVKEETLLKLGKSKKYSNRINMIDFIEKESINNSDVIICVSNFFKEVIKTKYRFKKKIVILPMLIDGKVFFYSENLRMKVRKKLNLEDRIVLVYSGSVSKYQKFESMLSFFKTAKKVDPNFFFLILTQKKFNDTVSKKMSNFEFNSKDYKVLNLEFSEVNDYLNASDIGLLFRDNILLNNVASPTKLLEYLAAGVYPLITPKIGDSEKIINDLNFGLVIDNFSSEESIRDFIKKYKNNKKSRKEISYRTRKDYNWDTHLETLEEIYAK